MEAALFEGDLLSVTLLAGSFAEIIINSRRGEINKLDENFTKELSALLCILRAQATLRGILITSGKKAFLSGADMNVLSEICNRPTAALVEFSFENGRALSALEDVPVPVVAAINGYALGGGLEVALCADYRILASDGQVGLPEVGFGILPGWGGTTRLPRLTSGRVALDWIIGARPQIAQKALDDGVVDAIAEPARLRETALSWLNRASAGETDWRARRRRRQCPFELDDSALLHARENARKSARFNPAALAVADLLAECAPMTRDAALIKEAETFSWLAKTPTARALIAVFLSNQQIRKAVKNQAARGTVVRRAGVLGAGIMGGGIAYASAVNNIPVLLKDIRQEALNLGVCEAAKLLDKQVATGRMAQQQADSALASIVPALSFDQFDTVDLVVEAVVESLDVKHQVLVEVESRVRPGTVLASNTSSLAIGDIAVALRSPQRMVGMHFFNPVHQMPLVEVIRGPAADENAISTAIGYATAIGKTPLVVKDCPGFLINRLLGAYMTAFLMIVHEGADFLEIDRVMEAWGWPMGPAYLMDVAGIDTLDKALAILAEAYPTTMATSFRTAIQLLAAEKRYGQKNAAGFYVYETDARGRPRRCNEPRVSELLGRAQPHGPKHFDDHEIEERLMLAMILEAARCLEEQVVATAAEIDVGMRLATGFPAHHAGPLWYADSLGPAEVARRCERYSCFGGLYVVDSRIQSRMRAGVPFYARPAPV